MALAMAAGIGQLGLCGTAISHRRPSSSSRNPANRSVLCVRASAPKLKGIDVPKVSPKLPEAFWGFTSTAELWNARAGMIGIVGITLVELILGRGILQTFGIEVGRGLNLPL